MKKVIAVILVFGICLSCTSTVFAASTSNYIASNNNVKESGITTIAGVQYEYTVTEANNLITTTVSGGGETATITLDKNTQTAIRFEQNGITYVENGVMVYQDNKTTQDNTAASSRATDEFRPPYWDRTYRCYATEIIHVIDGRVYDWCAVEGELNQYKKIWGTSSLTYRPTQIRPFIDAINDMSNAQRSAISAAGNAISLGGATLLAALSAITAGVAAVIAIFVGIGAYTAASPHIDAAETARLEAQDAWNDITGWHS